ncbi:MAG: ABC transporter permease [Vicinamibacterales bacterium]
MLNGVGLDFVHAWRSLRQSPWFSAGALATLLLGIGATVTVFSIVNALIFRPLPFGDRTDRLLTLHATSPRIVEEPGWGDAEVSYPDYLDYAEARAFDGAGAYMARSFVLSGDAASAERVQGGSVTPGLLALLGVEPILGRSFRDEDAAAPGLESVVLLTHGLWTRRYGAAPDIVGRTIMVNDGARTVIGVLPPGFRFPERDDLYMPLRIDDGRRAARIVNVMALLAPGETRERAQAELDAIAARQRAEYPASNRDVGVLAVPVRAFYVGAAEHTMAAVLMAAVGFVLLIVCANLANLMLVRGASRQREMAVRAAMGAGAARLARTALAESLMLAVPGAALGLLASQWALDWIRAWIPEDLPYWVRVDLDVRVALFTAGLAVFTAVAVGLVPAMRAARVRLASDLKDAGRSSSLGPAAQRLQAALSAGQVALCLALLVGAHLMVRSFVAQQHADLGFDDRSLLTARIYLAGDAFDDPRARSAFFRNATSRLQAIPGIGAVTATTSVPGDDGGTSMLLVADGRASVDDELPVQAVTIAPGFLDALGLRPLEGRTFTPSESDDGDAAVVMLNRSLAARLWPGEAGAGRRIALRSSTGDRWFRVVGIVPDVHYEEIGEETEASRLTVYVPYATDPSRSMALLMRTSADPALLVQPVRRAVAALSAGTPVYRVLPMRDLRRLTTWEQEFIGRLMATFATGALLLAGLGVYALVAYAVSRRTREIGIRLALGASPRDVVRMLVGQSGRVALAGTAAGLLLGVGIARVLSSRVFGAEADAALFAMAAGPLLAAVATAVWLPARRAGRTDPTTVLRDE